MMELSPVTGILSQWEGPTCPFCVCATCESGSYRYVDNLASWFQVSEMCDCLEKKLSCPSEPMHFHAFCFSFQFLAWNEPLLRVVYSYLHSRADLSPWGSLKLYSVGWSEAKNRGLSLSFFVSAHLLRSSELFQICWANFDNQYFGPYYGCRKPGPHHGRWYLGKHGKRRLGHL
jgi:hypothetical protein